MKPDIVVAGPMYPATLAALDDAFSTHHIWRADDPDRMLRDVAGHVRAIATTGWRGADAKLMDRLPKTELIACFGVGVDAIDLDAAKARGIAVTNTPDVLTDDVADLALALILAVARRVVEADRFVRTGAWLKGPLALAQKVGGKRLGILGLGRIGQAIARRGEAFGMRIAYHGPRRKSGVGWSYYERLVDLARDSDVLVVACPGGAETQNLVNAEVIAALGTKGVLVNIARGSVVDEPALVEALVSGRLGGAGLDVFEDEPRVPEALMKLDNVVLQPHQGSATHETRAAMGQLVIDNLKAHFAGRPLLTRVV